MGSPKVGLINRSMERAEQLINILKDKGFSQLPEIITEEQVDSFFDSSQKLLIVNATSLGLSPADPAPVSLPKTRKNIFVYDMIYNPPRHLCWRRRNPLVFHMQMVWVCWLGRRQNPWRFGLVQCFYLRNGRGSYETVPHLFRERAFFFQNNGLLRTVVSRLGSQMYVLVFPLAFRW